MNDIATWKVIMGDALAQLRTLPDASVQTCVTSPPYWNLRDYSVDGQIGLEETPDDYVDILVEIFDEVRRVLKDDGTLWLNVGDSYIAAPRGGCGEKSTLDDGGAHQAAKPYPNTTSAGPRVGRGSSFRRDRKPRMDRPHRSAPDLKPKDLVGIPWLLAFSLRAAGWYLRQDIVWSKKNCMPESITDRCTKSHEYIFLLSKSRSYFFDNEAIAEPAMPESAARYKYNFSGRAGVVCPNDNEGQRTAPKGKREFDVMRNKRSVWNVSTTASYSKAHCAVFPEELIEPCILAGAPEGGVVLDPFCGTGTTGAVAVRLRRSFIGIELNPEHVQTSRVRISRESPLFSREVV